MQLSTITTALITKTQRIACEKNFKKLIKREMTTNFNTFLKIQCGKTKLLK
jgi:hypothetical protein